MALSSYTAGPAKKLKTAEDQAKDEMARYKEEASLALSDDPLGWWKEHEGQYPFLSRVAKKHLSIPGTSVPSESFLYCRGHYLYQKRAPGPASVPKQKHKALRMAL